MTAERPDIADLGRAELEAWLETVGVPRWRASQILTWVHRRGVDDWQAMTNLPKTLRERLAAAFTVSRMAPAFVADAQDGTRKLLFHLAGDPARNVRAAAIESVLIPVSRSPRRLARPPHPLHLEPGRAAAWDASSARRRAWGSFATCAQARSSGRCGRRRRSRRPQPITNVVLMGMGEPLANYDAVRDGGRDPHRRLGPRHLSAADDRVDRRAGARDPALHRRHAGEPRGLAARDRPTRSAIGSSRSTVATRWRRCCARAATCRSPRRKRITFEYVLLDGENDTDDDARGWCDCCTGCRPRSTSSTSIRSPGRRLRPSPRGAGTPLPGDPARGAARRHHPRESRAGHPGRVRPARRGPAGRLHVPGIGVVVNPNASANRNGGR